MKIGCGTVLFRQYPLEMALEAIRNAGYEYFETQAVGPWCPHVDVYHDDPEKLVRLKERYGFKEITGLWALNGSLISNEKCVESVIRTIEWAAAAQIPIVHLGEGSKPEEMPEEEAYRIIEERLNILTEAAEKNGIRLALEPHGTFSLTLVGLKKMVSFGKPEVLGINFDAANIFRACYVDSGNPGARLQKIENCEDELTVLNGVAERVIHMHAKDLDKDKNCVAIGDGLVKVAQCVKLLKSRGYDGVVSVETEGETDFEDTVDIANRSYKALCRIVSEA